MSEQAIYRHHPTSPSWPGVSPGHPFGATYAMAAAAAATPGPALNE